MVLASGHTRFLETDYPMAQQEVSHSSQKHREHCNLWGRQSLKGKSESDAVPGHRIIGFEVIVISRRVSERNQEVERNRHDA